MRPALPLAPWTLGSRLIRTFDLTVHRTVTSISYTGYGLYGARSTRALVSRPLTGGIRRWQTPPPNPDLPAMS
eukprot:1872428-Prymnesium_polylepis.1